MEVKAFSTGKVVYQTVKFHDGSGYTIKVRECGTEESARAIANYYNVREE